MRVSYVLKIMALLPRPRTDSHNFLGVFRGHDGYPLPI